MCLSVAYSNAAIHYLVCLSVVYSNGAIHYLVCLSVAYSNGVIHYLVCLSVAYSNGAIHYLVCLSVAYSNGAIHYLVCLSVAYSNGVIHYLVCLSVVYSNGVIHYLIPRVCRENTLEHSNGNDLHQLRTYQLDCLCEVWYPVITNTLTGRRECHITQARMDQYRHPPSMKLRILCQMCTRQRYLHSKGG